MKLKIIAMMAALFFSANALAAIQITERQARNMDDVQSLGLSISITIWPLSTRPNRPLAR